MKANKYSNMRLRPDDDDEDNTYDEYNPDYVEMQDEMNDWMPADTAAMYRQLVKRLKREKAKKKIYGHDLFSQKSLTFEPNENVAMPRNYRLGPGDAVFIDIYGASQKSIEGTVAPDGMLTIEGFGPINVNGLTVEQANARVRSSVGTPLQQFKNPSVSRFHTLHSHQCHGRGEETGNIHAVSILDSIQRSLRRRWPKRLGNTA